MRRQRGLTIVELMIALTLGLMVTSVVLSMYLNTSRSHTQNERYAWMQENARYALKALTDDITMVDFWGRIISTDTISTTLAPAAGDCAVDIAVFDATTALLVNNYHASPAVEHFTPCAALSANRLPGTDVIALKRVEGSWTSSTFVDVNDFDGDADTTETLTVGTGDLENGEVYLRSNGTIGAFVSDAAPGNPPALGESDWRYTPRIYFVRDYYRVAGDGVPSLCRMQLLGLGLGNTQCIAEGVEDLHVQFGIDLDADGVANQYTSEPTAAQLENAVSARMYLLMRSTEPVAYYIDDNSYTLGDVIVAPPNDGYYRAVYSTTVVLRNTVARSVID